MAYQKITAVANVYLSLRRHPPPIPYRRTSDTPVAYPRESSQERATPQPVFPCFNGAYAIHCAPARIPSPIPGRLDCSPDLLLLSQSNLPIKVPSFSKTSLAFSILATPKDRSETVATLRRSQVFHSPFHRSRTVCEFAPRPLPLPSLTPRPQGEPFRLQSTTCRSTAGSKRFHTYIIPHQIAACGKPPHCLWKPR